ncbi:class F sortase [Nocardioides zeae]|uniref:LPXTG-site transpeptidase (Sortase) family protein n=1 Tax=Nocardioides zeae TaxID=1457234 RepID=A0AAJ1U3Q8_9ACTN|nr:class F sortase [Nocardioides zeae]MDQ1106784.1 LPXTG-site transpeptidase (sortase) family protein [Nocardioides zeae]
MNESTTTKRPGLGDALLSALTTVLLVMSVGMIGWGVAWPGGEADDGTTSSEFVSIDPAAPIRLEVPRIDVSAPIIPISVADGVLDPPRDAELVGWWNLSAKPGATQGQTVITGHTVHTGGGAMNSVGQLEQGDLVDVVSDQGRMRYELTTSPRYYSREDVTEKAEELFGQDHGDGALVLITCADWNGEYYENNVIVVGKPLGRPKDGQPIDVAAG